MAPNSQLFAFDLAVSFPCDGSSSSKSFSWSLPHPPHTSPHQNITPPHQVAFYIDTEPPHAKEPKRTGVGRRGQREPGKERSRGRANVDTATLGPSTSDERITLKAARQLMPRPRMSVANSDAVHAACGTVAGVAAPMEFLLLNI
eukprot:2610362-Rhodomonas_salina.3